MLTTGKHISALFNGVTLRPSKVVVVAFNINLNKLNLSR